MIHHQFIAASILLFAHLAASAGEVVNVKYHGPVDVGRMDCHSRPSSLVWRTCYDQANRYLVVNLKGTYYHYCRMPSAVVREWREAESMGRYYLANIKANAYDCRAGGIPSN